MENLSGVARLMELATTLGNRCRELPVSHVERSNGATEILGILEEIMEVGILAQFQARRQTIDRKMST